LKQLSSRTPCIISSLIRLIVTMTGLVVTLLAAAAVVPFARADYCVRLPLVSPYSERFLTLAVLCSCTHLPKESSALPRSKRVRNAGGLLLRCQAASYHTQLHCPAQDCQGSRPCCQDPHSRESAQVMQVCNSQWRTHPIRWGFKH
jgi:hypothetical protein